MSGHSKWATIKRAKEATDAKRSSTFSKISKDIILAARIGQSGDLNFNPMLRVAVTKAKAANMPSDKIEKAINRGLGVFAEGEQSFEKTYEAYTSDGIPVLVDVDTDNPNRALTEIRTTVNKTGGKMVPEGSISWQFKEHGLIRASLQFDSVNQNKDDLVLDILSENGVEDIEFTEVNGALKLEIFTTKESLREINQSLKQKFNNDIEIDEITIIKNNASAPEITEEQTAKLESLIELLKENEDVSNVWY